MRWELLLPCSVLLFIGSLLPLTNLSQAQSLFGLPFNNQIYLVTITDDAGGTRAFHAGTNHLKSKTGEVDPLE